MTDTRLTTRTELRKDRMQLYKAINENRQKQALAIFQNIEMNIIIYYNTRGLECTRFDPVFIEIRNLLERFSSRQLYKKKLFGYLFKLNKELRYGRVSTDNGGQKTQDPIQLLKFISDDLLDDYSSFNLMGGQSVIEKNQETLELIKDDLLEMRELEPLFRNKPDELHDKYNMLCKTINMCLMIIPQVKDVNISAKSATIFRQSFEGLFNMVTEIFIPIKSESKIKDMKASAEIMKGELADKEVEDREVEGREAEDREVEGKSLKQLAKDADMNIEEMERRAKEGVLDNADHSEK